MLLQGYTATWPSKDAARETRAELESKVAVLTPLTCSQARENRPGVNEVELAGYTH